MNALVPRTVYLPPAAAAAADERAKAKSISVGVLLRMIVMGVEPPLTPR